MTSRGPAHDGEADASPAVSPAGEAAAPEAGPRASHAPTSSTPIVPLPTAPARVRVTAPRPGYADGGQRAARGMGEHSGDPAGEGAVRAGSPAEASASPDAAEAADATDVHDVYVGSLIRSQLRLALICAAGFALATALFVLAIAWTPGLDESLLAGVPVSWLLLAVGVYPLALTIAVLYVRAAGRNEAQYRSLAEGS